MVGAAVAVARGALPRLALELAMESEVRVRFPLAPAEGLVLVGAGFDPNTNNEVSRRKQVMQYNCRRLFFFFCI
jgi:tRNA U38,U39,U40 pseudouridine synthase TruA